MENLPVGGEFRIHSFLGYLNSSDTSDVRFLIFTSLDDTQRNKILLFTFSFTTAGHVSSMQLHGFSVGRQSDHECSIYGKAAV